MTPPTKCRTNAAIPSMARITCTEIHAFLRAGARSRKPGGSHAPETPESATKGRTKAPRTLTRYCRSAQRVRSTAAHPTTDMASTSVPRGGRAPPPPAPPPSPPPGGPPHDPDPPPGGRPPRRGRFLIPPLPPQTTPPPPPPPPHPPPGAEKGGGGGGGPGP